jgi:hypothetical protein
MLAKLGFSGIQTPPGFALQGIGGVTEYVLVKTVLELTRDDGDAAHVRGELAAFTDPAATDLSILGRDVLNNFDVILSRRCNEVLLRQGGRGRGRGGESGAVAAERGPVSGKRAYPDFLL